MCPTVKPEDDERGKEQATLTHKLRCPKLKSKKAREPSVSQETHHNGRGLGRDVRKAIKGIKSFVRGNDELN